MEQYCHCEYPFYLTRMFLEPIDLGRSLVINKSWTDAIVKSGPHELVLREVTVRACLSGLGPLAAANHAGGGDAHGD